MCANASQVSRSCALRTFGRFSEIVATGPSQPDEHMAAVEQFGIEAGVRQTAVRMPGGHFFFVRVAPPRPRSGTSASSSNRCTKP